MNYIKKYNKIMLGLQNPILIACFFSFSFNNLPTLKIHYLLGQLSTYFVILSILFNGIQYKKRSLTIFLLFLLYLFSVLLFNSLFGNINLWRSFTSVMSVVFLYILVEHSASMLQKNKISEKIFENYFIYSSWAIIIISIPDIIAIQSGNIQLSFLEPNFFRYSIEPYTTGRLRGYTQEPSYLGMVISTLYPFAAVKLRQQINLSNIFLVLGLWLCLIFTLSKVGIITCVILTALIFFTSLRNLILFLSIFLLLNFLLTSIFSIETLILQNENYIKQWASNGIDISTVTRFGSIVASINAFLENPLFGVGFAQLGFLLPNYYPDWFWLSPESTKWAQAANQGGAPSFSFVPKLIAEVGLFGLLIIVLWLHSLLLRVIKHWGDLESLRPFIYSFIGFLIASFGVEGYLYIPAWLIFGVIVGSLRQDKQSIRARIS